MHRPTGEPEPKSGKRMVGDYGACGGASRKNGDRKRSKSLAITTPGIRKKTTSKNPVDEKPHKSGSSQ